MMHRKFILLLGMALILLAGAACTREEVPAADGKVTISFRVGETDTKAVSPGDGNIADGGGIFCTRVDSPSVVLTPDLYIFICDWETGNIVKRYPGDGNVEPESDWSDGNKSTFLSVSFNFNVEGTYTVYALGNVSGEDSNLTLPSASAITAITNASQLDALLISLSDPALDAGSRMPLSAKGLLNVVKGMAGDNYNGHVELQMLRCFNKVQLSFKNLTGAELNLYNCQITLKDLNVQQGWLFPTSPDFAPMGDGNSDGKDDNYRDFTSAETDVTGIDHEAKRSFFASPVLFLPSVAPTQTTPSKGQRYLVDVSFRIPKTGQPYDADNPATYDEKSFTNLPIHTPKSMDITSLGRNQYLQIVTTVSKGLDVSFNFKVNEWVEHTEYVTFD